MVEISNLGVRFTKRDHSEVVFNDFSVSFSKGKIYALLGESGCGKSTLLSCILGVQEGAQLGGEIRIDGKYASEFTKTCPIGFAEQDPPILPWATVRENVELGARLRHEKINAAEISDLIEAVGLSDASSRKAGFLSGGQRKRVGFIRALSGTPRVLLLDEVFSGCDLHTRQAMLRLLHRVWNDKLLHLGATILMVTHSVDEASLLAHECLVLASKPCRIASSDTVKVAPLARDFPKPGSDAHDHLQSRVSQLRDKCVTAWDV